MIINLYKAKVHTKVCLWWGSACSRWGLPMMRFCLRLLTMYFSFIYNKFNFPPLKSVLLLNIMLVLLNQSWYSIVMYKHRTLIIFIPLDTKVSLCKFLSWLSNIFQNLIFCETTQYFLNLIFYLTQIINLIFNYLGDNNSYHCHYLANYSE